MNNRPTRSAAAFAIAAALLLLPLAANAAEETPVAKSKPAIELGAPFTDNAILQRQMPVPVWGWSKPGTKITVEFAGQKKIATAGKDGNYKDYSAIAFAFAHKLYEELKVPIGILNCSFSMTSIQAWVPRVGFREGTDEYSKAIYKKIIETDPTTPEHKSAWNAFYQSLEDQIKENDERIKRGEEPKKISVRPPGNLGGNRDASWLFNGRLNPVIPYAIRGGIWNQGYNNMGEGLPYYNNLHSLVRGWRLRWDNPELPVYFHQFYCPGQKGGWNNSPSIGGTAEMRLGTWPARDIPNAGMASQIDITGAIHYLNKAVRPPS